MLFFCFSTLILKNLVSLCNFFECLEFNLSSESCVFSSFSVHCSLRSSPSPAVSGIDSGNCSCCLLLLSFISLFIFQLSYSISVSIQLPTASCCFVRQPRCCLLLLCSKGKPTTVIITNAMIYKMIL